MKSMNVLAMHFLLNVNESSQMFARKKTHTNWQRKSSIIAFSARVHCERHSIIWNRIIYIYMWKLKISVGFYQTDDDESVLNSIAPDTDEYIIRPILHTEVRKWYSKLHTFICMYIYMHIEAATITHWNGIALV